MVTMRILVAVVLTVFRVSSMSFDSSFDEFGNAIVDDQLAEVAAMRSTGLGYGLGTSFYYNLSGLVIDETPSQRSPFHRHNNMMPFPHHLFKRQASHEGEFFENSRPFDDQIFHKDDFSKDFLAGKDFPKNSGFSEEFGSGFQKPAGVACIDKPVKCDPENRYRTYTGMCNNIRNPYWGSTMQPLTRMLTPLYMDGHNLPRLHSRYADPVTGKYPLLPSARLVSRNVHTPSRDDIVMHDINSMFQQWGQFIDHDMTGTPVHKGPNGDDLKCCEGVTLSNRNPFHSHVFKGGPCFPIHIPHGDHHFSRSCMNFVRSQGHPKRQVCQQGPREQMNIVTSYLDASSVYASKDDTASNLRTYNGGKLKTQKYNLLPPDEDNKDCVKDTSNESCFKAGEKRVNEHPGLSALHTMLHREHNRICGWLQHYNPHWSDGKIYQEARKIVGSMLQHITYNEWLPILLGPTLMSRYRLHVDSASSFNGFGPRNWYYDDKQDPRIINSFAAAALRIGHTLVPSTFTIGQERIELRKLFNRPKFLYQQDGQGVSMVGEGLVNDALQLPDRFINIELTDHLFEDMQNKSMDLASLNINRGRDHGLPPYNDFREYCGLNKLSSFSDMKDGDVFASVYRHIDDVDLFTGGIAEAPLSGGLSGPTLGCIIATQFRAIKYGDRYWYENMDSKIGFTPNQLLQVKKVSMATLMCNNMDLGFIQTNAFTQPNINNPKVRCDRLPVMDLSHWIDQ